MYEYSYYGPMDENLEALFSSFSLATAGIGLVIGLAVYIMSALALYRIASRRGLRNAWLAWIPVGDGWILGSICDQYRYLVHGQNTNRRRVLLWLGLANTAGVVVLITALISAVVKVIAAGVGAEPDAMVAAILGPIMAMLGVGIVTAITGIVYMVFYYISLSDLFRSCDPANATVYLVLSIVGNVLSGVISYAVILEPIFLLVTHGRDLGMPPRKEAPTQTYSEPTYQPPEEPWVQE